jgi:hypothetical protein
MACREVDAAERSQALLDAVCPLDAPCQYQASGPKSSPGQFITCDSTFDSARARGEHLRQHDCYPATCTKTEEMDGVELVKHLDEAHCLNILQQHSKSTRKVLTDLTNEQGPRKKAKGAKTDDME